MIYELNTDEQCSIILLHFDFIGTQGRDAKGPSQWRIQDFSDGAGAHDLDKFCISCTCVHVGLFSDNSNIRWTQKLNVI